MYSALLGNKHPLYSSSPILTLTIGTLIVILQPISRQRHHPDKPEIVFPSPRIAQKATFNMPLDDWDDMSVSHLAFHLASKCIIYVVTKLMIWVPIACLWRLSTFVDEFFWSGEGHKLDGLTLGYLFLAQQLAKTFGIGPSYYDYAIKISRITSMLERYLAYSVFRLNARVYLPLPSNSGTFRLLTIWPAESSDSIKCTLEIGFWQCSEYEALSYAWGDIRSFTSISMDDKSFLVTSELFAALHDLRSQTTKKVLWVDAICINQYDTREREHQVQQMEHIYQNAKRVVVWLGKQYSSNMNRALENLGRVQRPNRGYHDWLQRTEKDRISWEMKLEKLQSDVARKDLTYYALERLFRCQWWRRIWVAQEVSLASKVAFQYGPYLVDWDVVQEASRRLKIQIWPQFPDIIHRSGNSPSPAEWSMTFGSHKHQAAMSRHYSLLELAHMFRSRQATDSRDKLYGLLGIVSSPLDRGLIPEYSKPCHIIYMELFKRHLALHRDLFILSFAEYRGKYNKKLPTWCCDWTVEELKPIPFWTNNWDAAEHSLKRTIQQKSSTIYNAAGNTKMQLAYHPDPRILGIRGFVIDRVNTVGRAWSKRVILFDEDEEHCLTMSAIKHHHAMLPDSGSPLHSLNFYFLNKECQRIRLALMNAQQKFLAYILDETPEGIRKNWQNLVNKYTTYPADLLGNLAFKNTMTAGLYPYINGEFGNDVLEALGECESTFQVTEESAQVFKVQRYLATQSSYNRRFITTDNGKMGLAPIPTRPGDLVCILFGAAVPFILRAKNSEHYEVIGQTYIEGYMANDIEYIRRATDIRSQVFWMR